MQSEEFSRINAGDLEVGDTYVRHWPLKTNSYAQAFRVLEVTPAGISIEWCATERLRDNTQAFLPYATLDPACPLYRLADYQALVNSGALPPGYNEPVHNKIMQMEA